MLAGPGAPALALQGFRLNGTQTQNPSIRRGACGAQELAHRHWHRRVLGFMASKPNTLRSGEGGMCRAGAGAPALAWPAADPAGRAGGHRSGGHGRGAPLRLARPASLGLGPLRGHRYK